MLDGKHIINWQSLRGAMKLIELWDFDDLFENHMREIFIGGAVLGALLGFYWGITGWGFLAGLILAAVVGAIGGVLTWFALYIVASVLRAAIGITIVAIPAVLFIALVIYAFSK